ncbi:hypothetical protein [Tolypothrix sp. VBCCA 56010]|uniref:hypothetical protein n=1 Tax=Tolypothrix sp. VBCCA 56010 TaxID=3137731 RepID=UPI003D7E5492
MIVPERQEPTNSEPVNPQNQPQIQIVQGVLPDSLLGQKFLEYFHHPWHFINAPTPPAGERPKWTTETRYPLQPRNLWSLYQNPDQLLGLRFGTETNYLLLDADVGGNNHPANSLENFKAVLAAMEDIGLCRPVIIQSSFSTGIHIYYFFKNKRNSFYLAVAVFLALLQKGISIKDGHLEQFPNTKPYGTDKPTDFKAHRLPLQPGSFILDKELQPYSNNLEDFLDAAEWSASGQDDAALDQAIAHAKTQAKKLFPKPKPGKGATLWKLHLEEIFQMGWTGFHQTNQLLKHMGCYGIVFLSLKGEELVDFMVKTSQAAPGYRTWCRHQHEIRQRARDRARSCEKYYTPYPSIPNRLCTYRQQFGDVNNVVPFCPNLERHQKTLDRIAKVISTLKEQGNFPNSVADRAKAIIAASKAIYGVGGSQTTLHKPEYLALWHPAHEPAAVEESVNAPLVKVSDCQKPEKYPQLPDPWLEDIEPQSLSQQAIQRDNSAIYTPPPIMKVLYLPQAKEIENQKSIFNQQPATDSLEEIKNQKQFISNPKSTTDKQNQSIVSGGEIFQNNKPALSMTEFPVTTIETIPDSSINSEIAINDPIIESDSPTAITEVSTQLSTQASTLEDCPKADVPTIKSEVSSDLHTTPVVSPPPEPLADDSQAPVTEVSTQLSTPTSTFENCPKADVPTIKSEAFSDLLTSAVVSPPPEPLADDSEAADDSTSYTPSEYCQAIRLRLRALSEAKKWVKSYGFLHNLKLTPAERQEMEELALRILLAQLGSLLLWHEAREWFVANLDRLKRRGWGAIGKTLFPDLFG